jgi:ferredoxin
MPEIASSYEILFADFSSLANFLKKLSTEANVFAPIQANESLYYQQLNPNLLNSIVYDQGRTIQPLKSFFFRARQKVATYLPSTSPTSRPEDDQKFIIIGAKSCDLRALEILDKVFLEGDFVDPFYKQAREDNIIITSDCSSSKDTCSCTLRGIKPYLNTGFDLNLAKIGNGIVIDVGSEKGRSLIAENASFFQEASETQIKEREKNREALLEQVEKQNEVYALETSCQEIIRENLDSDVWKTQAESCVGCAACTSICPICHCFLLYDQKGEEAFERIRIWDYCQHPGFARMAAGSNPRVNVVERFRHRYLHKFDYMKENLELYGCVGCGRCIEACLGGIDMRKVLKELSSE